ncbi:MAG TPA: hypothetical protein GX506_05090 [Firmicutes bacterium]|nr:hypothetical protein [Bacillota bacterium]
MLIRGVEIDPAVNPAVLDTITWNENKVREYVEQARGQLESLASSMSRASSARDAARAAADSHGPIVLFPGSVEIAGDAAYLIGRCPDNQRILISIARAGAPALVCNLERAGARPTVEIRGEDFKAYVLPVNLQTISSFVNTVAPHRGPRALGNAPRLGVGNRQSVTVWPGIFQAMEHIKVPSEVIQNSAYRELAPMDEILNPAGRQVTYLPGHGSVGVGHTGNSIEGLWLYGVVSAMEHGFKEPFGADLDHIPVREGQEGIDKAKYLIDVGRDYSFFTLDTSPLFNTDALRLRGADLDHVFSENVPADERKRLLESGRSRGLDEERVKQLASAYWKSIVAASLLYQHIAELKAGYPFDFEFSLDEGPELTSPDEITFVLDELQNRGVRVHFIAPNVGFEKRYDYRRPDGLEGLSARVRELARRASEYGAVLDFHSGSDKSSATYTAISRAAGGQVKLKVAGKLQLILADVLADLEPGFFREWWEWSRESAKEEARRGNQVAIDYLAQLDERISREGNAFKPSSKDRVFTDFAFGMVGAKDESGRFLYRHRFYTLSPEVQAEYTRRVRDYLVKLAGDLELPIENR